MSVNLFVKNVINLEIVGKISAMFKDLTKVQINSERHATLAIKITDHHVHNFIIPVEKFTQILSKKTKNWKGTIQRKTWQVQVLSDKVKLFDENYEFIYRFSLDEWESIRQQFVKALQK